MVKEKRLIVKDANAQQHPPPVTVKKDAIIDDYKEQHAQDLIVHVAHDYIDPDQYETVKQVHKQLGLFDVTATIVGASGVFNINCDGHHFSEAVVCVEGINEKDKLELSSKLVDLTIPIKRRFDRFDYEMSYTIGKWHDLYGRINAIVNKAYLRQVSTLGNIKTFPWEAGKKMDRRGVEPRTIMFTRLDTPLKLIMETVHEYDPTSIRPDKEAVITRSILRYVPIKS